MLDPLTGEQVQPRIFGEMSVVVVDPVCNTNNVCARITESERQEIVAKALGSWETVNLASIDDDDEVWKEVFGPRFNVDAAA